MSTHPDSESNLDNTDAMATENSAPSESAASESTETPSESSAAKPSSSSATAPRKILIGSQRDAADASLRPARPVIQNASLEPARVGSAIKSESAQTTNTAVSSNESDADPDAAAQTERPLAAESPAASSPHLPATAEPTQSPAASAGADVDAELAAALDDLQMDSLMGGEPVAEEIAPESRVRGIVSRVHNENVFFTLKGHFEGVASLRQFKAPPEEGAMIDVVVSGFREEEGLYEVALPGAAVAIADWSDLTEGAVVDVKITGSNTGGLECIVNNIRGFIPASQIAIAHVDNFGDYINQKMKCVVTEVKPNRKRLVLSHRAILEREAQARKEELMKELSVGDTVDGVVTRLMDFGAFVDIGGVEGLVHISKLSWERVQHPKEVLEPGQKITVKIEKIAEDSGKIGLSLRDTQENPWKSVDQKYPAGAIVDGTVTRLAQFGAFVKLEPGVEGLVHISELAHHRVLAVRNVVSQGDQIQVKVLTVDPAAQKIGLSLKATQAKPEKAEGGKAPEEANEPAREMVVKKTDEPLKGGRGRSSGGEQFGLNW